MGAREPKFVACAVPRLELQSREGRAAGAAAPLLRPFAPLSCTVRTSTSTVVDRECNVRNDDYGITMAMAMTTVVIIAYIPHILPM